MDNENQQVVVPVVGTPEQQVAQPATPVAAPAPAQPITFNVGNAALDSAVTAIATAAGATDADLQRAIGVALERGDATLIDKAFIAEKFGSNAATFTTIAEAVVSEVQAKTEAHNAAVNAAIAEVAGDRATWDKHAAAFKETAPAHIQQAARAMLENGFIKEGMQFVISHTQGNVLPATGNLVGGIPSNQSAGLSAAEFREAQQKLMQEAGNRSLESGPYAERFQSLIKQRQIGKANGR